MSGFGNLYRALYVEDEAVCVIQKVHTQVCHMLIQRDLQGLIPMPQRRDTDWASCRFRVMDFRMTLRMER